MVKGGACFLTYKSTSCKNGDILKGGFSVLSEWGGFNSTNFQVIFQSVQDETCKQFSLDIFGDNEKGFLFLIGEFEEGKNLPKIGEFFLNIEDVAVLKLYFLFFLVVEEIGGDITSVETEAIDVFNLMVKGFSLFNGDDAMVTHFFIQIGKNLTDFFISVSRDCCYIEDSFLAFDWGWSGRQFLGNMVDSQVNTFFEVGWVHACLDFFVALFVDGSCKDGGSGCAISGLVIGFICDVFDEGGSDVGGFVGEVDCFGYCDSVFGDFGGAVALVDEDISASRSEGDLDCIGELLASLEELLSCLAAEEELLGGVEFLEMSEFSGVFSESWEHDIIDPLFFTIKFLPKKNLSRKIAPPPWILQKRTGYERDEGT